MNFEKPLTSLVIITSIVSIILTFVVSKLMIPTLGDGSLWWKLSAIISCGTAAGAIIPELVKVFTSTESRHVGEVVNFIQRRRRVAQHSVRLGRGKLFGLLAGHQHRRSDGGCLRL
jgi:hypothetical protein